jgi:carbon storage regulator
LSLFAGRPQVLIQALIAACERFHVTQFSLDEAQETLMLVLCRRPVESIRIGDSIVITVVEIRSGRIRLGIEAPDNVRIRRGEVCAEAPGHDPLATMHLERSSSNG